MKKRMEPQRPQSFFFPKTKNKNHFMDISSLLRPPGSRRFTVFLFLSSADKDQKMTEEEAESAEIILRKPPGAFDLPGTVGDGAAFPPPSRP
jgi:hypothetical protein